MLASSFEGKQIQQLLYTMLRRISDVCYKRQRGTANPGWKKIAGIRREERQIWSRNHHINIWKSHEFPLSTAIGAVNIAYKSTCLSLFISHQQLELLEHSIILIFPVKQHDCLLFPLALDISHLLFPQLRQMIKVILVLIYFIDLENWRTPMRYFQCENVN